MTDMRDMMRFGAKDASRDISGWQEEEKEVKKEGKRIKLRKRTLYLLGIAIYAAENVERDEDIK